MTKTALINQLTAIEADLDESIRTIKEIKKDLPPLETAHIICIGNHGGLELAKTQIQKRKADLEK